jgi:hypothetical protein
MRGRGNNSNNNRKGPNPLTRSYESNGPDVKIRGTAQQVAEKYTTLARDAHSSGDRVMAENYLQHAEHYNRIIATAQAAQMAAQQQQQQRDGGDNSDDNDDDTNDRNDRFQSHDDQRQHGNGSGPQPVIDGVPAEVAHSENNLPRENRQRDNRAGDGANEANGQHVNGQEASGDDDAPRKRPRRPRKPRNGEAGAPGEDGGQNANQATPPETVN